MAVYKEEKTNTWRVIYRYTDWNGERKQSQKRGFRTKREAQAWEREQLNKMSSDLDMTFKSFVEHYTEDMRVRIKENTWATKEHIIESKLMPYFGKLKMCNITAQQIISWQNEMMNYKDENGKGYSPVYLKTIHNQLSAIFNHAAKYYNLRENPCVKAGSMGKKKNREMLFWTKEEYLKFSEAVMDKPISFYLHMDEATPHLHIDFVPFITGSKRGLDTRVSLKQALAAQGFKGGTRENTEWNQWIQSEKEQLSAVMERHGIEWEHKGTHEKHLSVLDYKKQERQKEIKILEDKLAEKKDEFRIMSDRIENFDNGEKSLQNLDESIMNEPEYQLPEPSAIMSARTYKIKFVEPLIAKLKSLISTLFARYFKAIDSYNRLNITNANLYRTNERLETANDKLTRENENLRAENKDYKLLRKVFGSKQVDDLVERAKSEKQSKQREKRFRNYKDER